MLLKLFGLKVCVLEWNVNITEKSQHYFYSKTQQWNLYRMDFSMGVTVKGTGVAGPFCDTTVHSAVLETKQSWQKTAGLKITCRKSYISLWAPFPPELFSRVFLVICIYTGNTQLWDGTEIKFAVVHLKIRCSNSSMNTTKLCMVIYCTFKYIKTDAEGQGFVC